MNHRLRTHQGNSCRDKLLPLKTNPVKPNGTPHSISKSVDRFTMFSIKTAFLIDIKIKIMQKITFDLSTKLLN